MLEFTGFTEEDFKKIPVGLEISYGFIEKSKNKITAEFLDLPVAIYEKKEYMRKKKNFLIITFEK